MTDAPAPPPPPSASPPVPPPVSEVPINPNPASAPAPVTNTPPPATGAGRRDTIDRAFERARVERKGPAEARMGHNQPPEAMEKPKPPKQEDAPLNLKKRPDDQQPPPRSRDEGGRFSPRAETGQQRAREQVPAQQLPPAAPYRDPPRRMADHAKRDWAAAPESVRGEVHRMQREFGAAYQRYRGDHAAMNTIRPYHDLAQRQGTTLQAALQNYVGIENKLRQDPIGGLDIIVNNLNLRTPDGRRLGLADIAYHVLSRTPEQHQLMQSQNQQAALHQQLTQMQRYQQALAQQQAQMNYAQRFRHTRGLVDQFAEKNPRLDELADLIERELRLGFNLPTAYKRANLLRPPGSTPAAQTRTQRPAPQTRNADRSISGAPDGGMANGAGPRKSATRRGSIVNAMRRASGSL